MVKAKNAIKDPPNHHKLEVVKPPEIIVSIDSPNNQPGINAKTAMLTSKINIKR